MGCPPESRRAARSSRRVREQGEPLAPGDQAEMAVEPDEQGQQLEPPAQSERRPRKDVAGEDRHRGTMHLKRSLAVQEQLAEGVLVVEIDQAEERPGGLFDEAIVAAPQQRGVSSLLKRGNDGP